MASRRARIQIKPNIRPAKPATPAAKAGDAGKSKAASTAKTDNKAESSVESSKSTLKEAAEKKGEKVKSVEATASVSHDKTDSSTGADPSPSGEDISQDVPKASQDGGEEARNVSSLSSSAEVLPSENAALPSPGTAAPADSAVPRPSPVQPALARQEASDSQAGKAGSVPAITVTAAGDEPRQEPFPSVWSESPVKRAPGADMLSDHHDTGVLPSKEGAGVSGTAELSDHAHSKGADHSHPHGKSVDHGRSKSADHVHSKSHDHSHGKSLDHGHSKSLLHAHPKTPDHSHAKASEHGYFRGTDHGAKGPEGIHKGRTESKKFNAFAHLHQVHTIRKRRTPVDKNLLPSTDEPPPKTLKMRELVHWNPKSNPMSSTASV